jgi:hypothetical protein
MHERSAHQPNRLIFENTMTGEQRTNVRFGSPEHHELMQQRRSDIWHAPLWRQVHTPPTTDPKEDQHA